MVQSFALADLGNATTHRPRVILLNAVQGIVIAFDMPVRQAFLPSDLGKEGLANAIALELVDVQPRTADRARGCRGHHRSRRGRMVLPDRRPEFLAVIVSLLTIKGVPATGAFVADSRRPPAPLEGGRYVFGFAPIRSVILCFHGFSSPCRSRC